MDEIDKKDNIDNKIPIKAILIGESLVGKTSLILRFTEDRFENYSFATVGVISNEKILKINGKNIKYQIWDTAGQEKFRGMGKRFYTNANIGILVYDITKNKTFKEIQKYWYQELIENSPKDIGNFLYMI